MVYQVVASRRLQWDNLLWQVPALSLTAQAFLFTIAIGGTSSRPARIIASLLAFVVTVLCTSLMTRHRQAEIHDARWLETFEAQEWGKNDPADNEQAGEASPHQPLDFRVHGRAFRDRRNAGEVDGGWIERIPIVRPWPGYRTWIAGLLVFGLAAVAVFTLSIWNPDVFLTPQRPCNGPTTFTVPTSPAVTPAPSRP